MKLRLSTTDHNEKLQVIFQTDNEILINVIKLKLEHDAALTANDSSHEDKGFDLFQAWQDANKKKG